MKNAFTLVLVLCSVCLAQSPVPEWCRALPRPEYKALERVPSADPWFEVYKVAPQTFAVYEPHQSEETISYLIVGRDRALLFDTGMGIGDLRKVVTALTKLPIVVLNSHTHNDHVSDNWQFATVYGMDTDFTRVNALGSREEAQPEIAPGEICGSLPPGFNAQAYAVKPWKISRFIHDSEAIDLGGRSIQVISTPGHTPDAISLFDRAVGLLFTGDTYYPAPIWLFRPETDNDAYAASIRKLVALAPHVKVVLGAHNIPVAKPDVLPKLVTAFDQVMSGKATSAPLSKGRARYQAGDFTFLMREPGADGKPMSVADELKQLEHERSEAQVQGDVAKLDELLAPEFVEINSMGVVRTKAQNLAGHRAGETHWERFDLIDLQVEVRGLTAIVRGHLIRKGSSGGRDLSGETNYARYFVRRDGRWEAVFQFSIPTVK